MKNSEIRDAMTIKLDMELPEYPVFKEEIVVLRCGSLRYQIMRKIGG